MAEQTYTDFVPVLRGHLEEILEALYGARGFHSADDLARQFKNVGGTHRPSNLTTRLEKAVARTEGYLAVEVEDEPVPEA